MVGVRRYTLFLRSSFPELARPPSRRVTGFERLEPRWNRGDR
jgi:hypothetical protein